MKKLLLFAALFIYFQSIYAIDVEGNQSGEWRLEDSPVRVIGEVVIPVGETLLIEPGVVVDFTDSLRILIRGTLLAQGTVSDSIIFKQEIPGQNHYSLDFSYTATQSVLEYCRIQDGIANGETVYEGQMDYAGGGIYIEWSSPVIRHCTIINNSATYGGGFFIFGDSSPEINGNYILRNQGTSTGGGITANGGSEGAVNVPSIVNNIITENSSYNGGGISIFGNSSSEIINNLIYNNSAGNTGGGLNIGSTNNTVTVRNTIIWNNSAPDTTQVVDESVASVIEYCSIESDTVP